MKIKKTRMLTQCALFAALLCICSPITIPIGIVPVSMGIFAVMLAGIMLDVKSSFVAVAVYILIGLCGIPLFSGGKSGIAALVGPTGGYVWSYLIMAVVISFICKNNCKRKKSCIAIAISACILGTTICYACGTLQFVAVTGYTVKKAIMVCVLPFIPFDIIKAVCAALLGTEIKSRLKAIWF